MSAHARHDEDAIPVDDLAQRLLDSYGGDSIAALQAVIADAAVLYDELYTASCLLSRGVARGWQPRFQREQ